METPVTGAGYAEAAGAGRAETTMTWPGEQERLAPPGSWTWLAQPVPQPRAPGVAAHPSEYRDEPKRAKRPITGPQRAGAILLAATSLIGAAWYIPRVVAADARSFTGTVTTAGITDLNFASAGRVGSVYISLGETVRAGQILATETSPRTIAVLNADRASITADQAILRQLNSTPGGTSLSRLAAARAQLAKDQARLASDRVRRVETEILAPSPGTVVAINGQAGETVSASGIHNYSSLSSSSATQQPAFSLLPEGPRSSVIGRTTESALPMIALRTSAEWLVNVLIPQGEIASVHPGQSALVSVPAVGLDNVEGFVQGLSPTPVNTSGGVAYQVAITVSGHQRATPFSGMTANVELTS